MWSGQGPQRSTPTWMPAPACQAAVMLEWSSGQCRGTEAERTPPDRRRHLAALSGLQVRLPPVPQIHFHAPVKKAGDPEKKERLVDLKRFKQVCLSVLNTFLYILGHFTNVYMLLNTHLPCVLLQLHYLAER